MELVFPADRSWIVKVAFTTNPQVVPLNEGDDLGHTLVIEDSFQKGDIALLEENGFIYMEDDDPLGGGFYDVTWRLRPAPAGAQPRGILLRYTETTQSQWFPRRVGLVGFDVLLRTSPFAPPAQWGWMWVAYAVVPLPPLVL